MIEAPIQAPRPTRGSKAMSVVLALAAFVAVGGLTFALGRLTAPAAAATNGGTGNRTFLGAGGAFPSGPLASGAPGFGVQGGPGGLLGAGGFTVRGRVDSVAAEALTVTLASGTTVQIPLDGLTTYHRQADASAGDVQVGSEVLVELGGRLGDQANGARSPNPSAGPRLGTALDVTIVGR